MLIHSHCLESSLTIRADGSIPGKRATLCGCEELEDVRDFSPLVCSSESDSSSGLEESVLSSTDRHRD